MSFFLKKGPTILVLWEPYHRAPRLSARSFEPSSHVAGHALPASWARPL